MHCDDKIDKALSLLKDASQEKKIELKKLMSDLFSKVTDAEHATVDKIKTTAADVNKNAHDKPWYYVAGAVVGGMLLGHLLRRRRD